VYGGLEGIFDIAIDEGSLAYALRPEHDDFGFKTVAHCGRDVEVEIRRCNVGVGVLLRSGQAIRPSLLCVRGMLFVDWRGCPRDGGDVM
jgi:hypothetical protein